MTTIAVPEKLRVFAVIGRSFGVLFRNFVTFGVLTVVLNATNLWWFLQGFLVESPEAYVAALTENQLSVFGILLSILGYILFIMLFAGIVYGTVRDLSGERPRLMPCLRHSLRAVLPCIAYMIIGYIVLVLILALTLVPMFLFSSDIVKAICVTLALVLTGYVIVRYWVTVPSLVVERTGIIGSIRRAAALSKGNRLRIAGVLLMLVVVGIPYLVLAVLIASVFGGWSLLIDMDITSIGSSFFAIQIITYVLSLFFFAYASVVTAVLHHDLREVMDGVTARDMATVFE